ncbi:MAG: hypothetical protein WB986_05105 [Methanoregula sp.]|uniref:hypothetical protein n=1 Tax=Methanoregula sp. TaxID=2052170 RepID=UPI003BB171DD
MAERLGAAESEKLYAQQFFQEIKNEKKEHGVQDEADDKIQPACYRSILHDQVRECISDNNGAQNTQKKDYPFFDISKFHKHN